MRSRDLYRERMNLGSGVTSGAVRDGVCALTPQGGGEL
jgi:hypothetical protein